jgi:hypothetical protein
MIVRTPKDVMSGMVSTSRLNTINNRAQVRDHLPSWLGIVAIAVFMGLLLASVSGRLAHNWEDSTDRSDSQARSVLAVARIDSLAVLTVVPR